MRFITSLVLASSLLAPVAGIAVAEEAKPAATATVGKAAPDFALKDLDGKEVKLSSFKGKTVVLEWFNPGCPYVKKSHTVGSLVGEAAKHTKAGIVWLAINSGGAGKQGAALEDNKAAVKTFSLAHPVLLDPTGATGKAYGATNTPNMFIVDKKGNLAYAGAIDNSPDGEKQAAPDGKLVNFVDDALADLAANKPVRVATSKPYGCGVKYADGK